MDSIILKEKSNHDHSLVDTNKSNQPKLQPLKQLRKRASTNELHIEQRIKIRRQENASEMGTGVEAGDNDGIKADDQLIRDIEVDDMIGVDCDIAGIDWTRLKEEVFQNRMQKEKDAIAAGRRTERGRKMNGYCCICESTTHFSKGICFCRHERCGTCQDFD